MTINEKQTGLQNVNKLAGLEENNIKIRRLLCLNPRTGVMTLSYISKLNSSHKS